MLTATAQSAHRLGTAGRRTLEVMNEQHSPQPQSQSQPQPQPQVQTQPQAQSAPPAPPVPPVPPAPVEQERPGRTVGVRILVGSAVGAFVLGILTGGGFGALIGYVAHPDGPGDRPAQVDHEHRDFPQPPGFGSQDQEPSTS